MDETDTGALRFMGIANPMSNDSEGDDIHAVRWARREVISTREKVYTKYWHISIDGDRTLCGHSIPVGLSEGSFLPETTDAERADCPRCLNKKAEL